MADKKEEGDAPRVNRATEAICKGGWYANHESERGLLEAMRYVVYTAESCEKALSIPIHAVHQSLVLRQQHIRTVENV